MKNPILRNITRLVGRAIGDFGLIQEGDRILVALSGGKDSWTLLYALRALQRKAPVRFDLAAVTVHPGPKEFDCRPLEDRLLREGIPHTRLNGNLVKIINENLTEGTNPCSFCSRLRRGILYSYASSEGWHKIALGHHRDDFIETLLLNLFFNASIKGMTPHLLADDGKNRVIRPLVYVSEDMTRSFARTTEVPILGCFCSYQGMSGTRRQWIKERLAQMEKEIPGVKSSILHSMRRIHHRHLLSDGRAI
ncbi:MAG: ATP-binding protein [Desulfomonilaceae bacterium]|nr:ATP-binding protein [Desulfomonilaceae bacterium]